MDRTSTNKTKEQCPNHFTICVNLPAGHAVNVQAFLSPQLDQDHSMIQQKCNINNSSKNHALPALASIKKNP
jgi:hypothetical protein